MRSFIFEKKHRYISILILVALFHIINHYLWLKADGLVIHYRYKYQFTRILYHYFLTHPSLENLKLALSQNNFTPPFYPFSVAVLNLLFGLSPRVTMTGNLIYLIILMFCVYYIGKKIGDSKIGLLAAFILSMYPVVFKWLREFRIIIALTALVALSICFLMYSRNFINRRYSLFLGISMGLGSLINWTFPIFLTGPLIYYIILIFINKKSSVNPEEPVLYKTGRFFKERADQIINLSLSLAIAFLITAVWYLPYASLKSILNVGFKAQGGGASPFYYILYLAVDQISLFYFFIFLMAIPFFLKLKSTDKAVLLLWIVGPLSFLFFVSERDPRYVVAFIPAIAIISSMGLLGLPNLVVRRVLIGIIIVVSFFGFYLFSYRYSVSFGRIFLKSPWGDLYLLSDELFSGPLGKDEDKLLVDILEVIRDNSSQIKKPALVRVITDDRAKSRSFRYLLNDSLLACYSYTNGYPLSFNYDPYLTFSFRKGGYFPPLDTGRQESPDFIITCAGSEEVTVSYPEFLLIKEFSFESGGSLSVLKRR
ncbi:MAG: glycosyltransferase family 39 protein [Candidatus Omnitrophica bacterium]|nr:glycosyltransferase family 39 protein [Candidatus Omnitrophota bacterium]